MSELAPDYLNQPLPGTVRRLDAGFDSSCEIGGTANIQIQCFDDDAPTTHVIIREAPVIGTDPEGFTAVIVSLADHEKLAGLDLYWASCDAADH